VLSLALLRRLDDFLFHLGFFAAFFLGSDTTGSITRNRELTAGFNTHRLSLLPNQFAYAHATDIDFVANIKTLVMFKTCAQS
jgi:hypothetical protein